MTAPENQYLARLREAIAALRDVRAERDALLAASTEPVAIIGLGCRFPGGGDGPEAFWQSLERGVDAVREIPANRWPPEAIPANRPQARWAALLDEVERFDATFFGISPREAESLDPQQRLLLEVAWEALENAGQRPDLLAGGAGGVFVGLCFLDYQHRLLLRGAEQLDAHCATGNLVSTAAGRLSYFLGFQGPSISVDTACSSSLISTVMACQSLRARESDVALAGGVNLILSPFTMTLMAETQALAPDGRCRTFDARASGYVRGEGCGMVVLKRLSDAQRDGDPIRALIRGWAINQDGRSTGLTAPNVLSQQALLRRALEHARVPAEAIGYVELHGTGTPLGDPIEADALREVLGKPRVDGSSCILGAVKTNIGHLEAAAGVAGLIKAVLALEHEAIPPNLHFRRLNPRILLDGTPLTIPTATVSWKREIKPRFAGVSGFGISGTNAHVVLEEAPVTTASPREEAPIYLLPLSAKSPEALLALARSYAEHLAAAGHDAPLSDLAYTASVRRMHHDHRLAVAGRTREQLAASLLAISSGTAATRTAHGRVGLSGPPKLTLVFSGQGSQWVGMGQRLLAEEPVFRATIEACDALLRRHVPWSLLEELSAPEVRSRLGETEVVQPALFALQVGLAALLMSRRVTPDAVIGHSVGEIAAAHIAGALSLEEAIRIVAWRGRIMQKATGLGKMAWVALPREMAALAIAGREATLAIAAVNDPESVVLSGDTAALDEVIATLSRRGVECRPLKVNYAFHSPQMDTLARELVEALGIVDARRATVPLYSTTTGAALEGEALDAAYWGRNVRTPVQFAAAVASAFGDGQRLFLEIGPHPVLATNVARCLAAEDAEGHVVFTLRRQADEAVAMREALGALWARGLDLDWKALYPAGGSCVALPTYPWQRERYWIEPTAAAQPSAVEPPDPLDDCVYEVQWRNKKRAAAPAAGLGSPSGGAWLVFGDRGGLGAALAARLAGRGQTAVRVVHGEGFVRVEPDLYRIDLASVDDLTALLREAFGKERPCRGVVHLSSLDAAPWEQSTAETLESDQRIGFSSAVALAQTIVRQSWRDKPRLWLVTQGAQSVEGGPVTGVAQAPIWGLGRTIALEHPELECTLVDLDPARGADQADDLLGEIAAPDGETQIALRGGARYLARLVRSRFDAAPVKPFQIVADATYLVTGGLGGLGLAAAAWLVERGARHLALVGRRAPTEEAQTIIAGLEAQGARVLALSADVCTRQGVNSVLARIAEQLPTLRGVIHAAGVNEVPTPLSVLKEDAFWRVIAVKMLGAHHLDAATRGLALDFFVLYSSASAALGLVGQAAYAAANATLDAVAHARCMAGRPGLSVQWGPFSRVGMGARGSAGELMGRAGLESLTPEQGGTVLGRLLARPRPEVAVMSLSTRRWFDVFPQLAGNPFWSELKPQQTDARAVGALAARLLQSLRAAAPTERRGLLERHVKEQLGQVLRLAPERVDRLAPFNSLGVDSLMSVEARNRLEASLGLKLSAALLFTYANVDVLAAHLLQELGLNDIEVLDPEPPDQAFAVASADDDDDLLAAFDASMHRAKKDFFP